MAQSGERFAQLLTEGVHRIRLRERKNTSVIQDELGYALGRDGGSSIEYWRKGHIPPKSADVAALARILHQRANFERDLMEQFLESAGYAHPAALCEELYPRLSTSAVQSRESNGGREPAQLRDAILPHTLPAASTPFIGRKDLIDRLDTLLFDRQCRLITLVGEGGVGKTRLALHVARSHLSTFADSVFFVSLASIQDPALVVSAIAQALNMQVGAEPVEMWIKYALSSKEMLLILDNFEHLLAETCDPEGTALTLLVHILQFCPNTKILVTSRERLNLQEEWLLPVSGLSEEEAAELFMYRARQVQPFFATEGQETDIGDICKLVEGLPLAIELAAGWMQILTCPQIAQQIRQDFAFLSTNLHGIPPRHRSLQALFDHSWRLLSAEERSLLMGLSVFRGGFTVEEAAGVCDATLPLLLALVEKSLVQANGTGRYNLHELIRWYAYDYLVASGMQITVQRRHFDIYLALAERAAAQIHGPQAPDWLNRLGVEQDNLRAAWVWGVGQGDGDSLFRLGVSWFWFWFHRGPYEEGAGRLKQLLAQLPVTSLSARALTLLHCSTLLARSGNLKEAAPAIQQGYALAQQMDDPYVSGYAALCLGQLVADPAMRQRWARLAVEYFRHAGARAIEAEALWLWGDELREQGRTDEAQAAYTEGLRIFRELGNVTNIVYPLGNLGRLALLDGDLGRAHASFTECVELCRRSGSHLGLVDWLLRLGIVFVYQEDVASAREALEESLALAQQMAHHHVVPNLFGWLAHNALMAGDISKAQEYMGQSRALYLKLFRTGDGDGADRDISRQIPPDITESLVTSACIAAARGHFVSAVISLSCAEKIREELRYPLEPPLQRIADDLRVTLQTKLDVETFVARWTQGKTMSWVEVLSQ